MEKQTLPTDEQVICPHSSYISSYGRVRSIECSDNPNNNLVGVVISGIDKDQIKKGDYLIGHKQT
jgi:hypothetical protein